MVTTRSKTAQTKFEDFNIKSEAPQSTSHQSPIRKPSPPKPNISRKRKALTEKGIQSSPTKRSKTTQATPKSQNANDDTKIIIINRAPVLHLWGAVVTQHTYPSLPWSTCLSAGSAISSICAIAKGRAIGTVPEKEAPDSPRGEEKQEEKQMDHIEVMHFKLELKDGLALVGTQEKKGKTPGEEALRKKFGGEREVGIVKRVFEEALEGWKGDEVNKRAFGWYEEFRPDVKGGQKGWGRTGELDLAKVRTVVAG